MRFWRKQSIANLPFSALAGSELPELVKTKVPISRDLCKCAIARLRGSNAFTHSSQPGGVVEANKLMAVVKVMFRLIRLMGAGEGEGPI